MVLTHAQAEIAKDNHRFRVVCCGRRFGKTTLAILEMLAKAFSKNDQRIAYIAPTYQQARDIAWQELKKVSLVVQEVVNESRLEIKIKTQYGGNSSLCLRGWESVETLRGQHFDFVVLDEIAMMRNWNENWQEVIRPTLTDTKGEVLFISTPKGFNHFYDLFSLEKKDEDFRSFHFTSYDNPNIPKEEIDKAKQEITDNRFAQEYLADFRKVEGLVYQEFDRFKHVYKELPKKTYKRHVGIDFGYTNPCAILLILEDYDGNYFIEDEWYKRQKLNPQIIQAAKDFDPHGVYPDPEAPEKIAELENAGLMVYDVKKGKDSIKNGIDNVHELFKTGRLKVNEKCVNTILEFETYHYPDDKTKLGEPELPEKEDDHAMDALRYVVMTEFRRGLSHYASSSPSTYEDLNSPI